MVLEAYEDQYEWAMLLSGDDNLNGLDGKDRLNGGNHDVRGDFCKNGENFFGCELEVTGV